MIQVPPEPASTGTGDYLGRASSRWCPRQCLVSRHSAYLRAKGWAMSLARLVVTAVRIEGRTKAEVARDYGVSPRWVYELCRRFDAEGEAGLEPRSRRPRASPGRIPEEI